jgi:gluconate:H+ symporter, GntP family
MLDAGWIFAAMAGGLAVLQFGLRLPLPLGMLLVAMLGALLGGFGLPFRHLVEGGFGYLNLILALFAGAFFGQAMHHCGATELLAERVARYDRRVLPLLVAGVLLFVTGMLTGVAGVAVLAVGAFAARLLSKTRLSTAAAAAYIALMGTLGMVAPPLNVPAMIMADGVNMPYAGFSGSLLALSLPAALFALVTFARAKPEPAAPDAPRDDGSSPGTLRAWLGLAALVAIIVFWVVIRSWPALVFDPSIPLVLVLAGLAALLMSPPRSWVDVVRPAFTGTPLLLAAVLVSVGVLVQIMALTGVRGWLVIQAMSSHPPGLYGALMGLPLLGSVLTSMGTANSLGVPFAFAFIHQDMILNISALSAIAALSEFCPPTAISTALAAYVVGETRLWPIIRHALPTLVVLVALAILMLMFAPALAPYLR